MHNVNTSILLSTCKVSHEIDKGLRKIHEILANFETAAFQELWIAGKFGAECFGHVLGSFQCLHMHICRLQAFCQPTETGTP